MRSTASTTLEVRLYDDPAKLPAEAWDELLGHEDDPSPFMRHAYLRALHDSGAATPQRGWTPRFLTLWQGRQLMAACPLYLKTHSWGEYVFDWAWADAHERHGLRYYPKALVAVPFTPVSGARLLARDPTSRRALLQAVLDWVRDTDLSSLHLLFLQPHDVATCEAAGLLLRHTVQFHWYNQAPASSPSGLGEAQHAPTAGTFLDFEHFLRCLRQEKRKKIRQERRKVAEAGVTFRHALGSAITPADWAFFYRCYERTYLEHGHRPYLDTGFFARMASDMPEHWLLFVAERDGRAIASSLIALDPVRRVAYGRYWGALERVDCLHFEACYYQPIEWCIRHGWCRFEGGAQGEHKLARALLPATTTSAHWLAHPAFADAIARYLAREGDAVEAYTATLAQHSPLKGHAGPAPSPRAPRPLPGRGEVA